MLISEYELPNLAMWPQPSYEKTGHYLMHVLKLKKNGDLKWVDYLIEKNGHFYLSLYDSYDSAVEIANKENSELIKNIEDVILSSKIKDSVRLKAEKMLMVKSRLADEEQLMLAEAIKRNLKKEKVNFDNLKIADDYNDHIKEELILALEDKPYLEVVRIAKYGCTLRKSEAGLWFKIKHTKKTAIICYRECIARGFGFAGWDHWGKTKAAIRSILLPQANKLLQLASVKLMLADALHKGQKVLVCGSFVFWYEKEGNVGWIIKEVSNTNLKDSADTVYKKGKIISKNHGRIVVLPYVKSDGREVPGHTKNAPNDGKALPRHNDDYLVLPFEVLNSDLMIGLFGELHYE